MICFLLQKKQRIRPRKGFAGPVTRPRVGSAWGVAVLLGSLESTSSVSRGSPRVSGGPMGFAKAKHDQWELPQLAIWVLSLLLNGRNSLDSSSMDLV